MPMLTRCFFFLPISSTIYYSLLYLHKISHKPLSDSLRGCENCLKPASRWMKFTTLWMKAKSRLTRLTCCFFFAALAINFDSQRLILDREWWLKLLPRWHCSMAINLTFHESMSIDYQRGASWAWKAEIWDFNLVISHYLFTIPWLIVRPTSGALQSAEVTQIFRIPLGKRPRNLHKQKRRLKILAENIELLS